jgi:putative transposase
MNLCAPQVRELIVRTVRENPRWGYFRIRGELLKLGHTVSATTVRSVLRRSHVPPAGRRSQMSWRQFLSAHAESLVATVAWTIAVAVAA